MALTLQAVVSLNRGGFDSGVSTMSQLVGNAAGAMSYAFGGVTAEIMTMTRAFGPLGTAIAVLKQVTDIGQEFQYTMANVATVTSLTADEMLKVESAARKFAETTAFTATQAGDALYALASAGFSSAQDLEQLLVPALKLAGATQADTKLATESLTVTLNAFRLGTEDAARVADLFAGVIATSPATMERLGEAMSQANPIAAAFGMSLEQTVESIAAFHTVGLMGSEAGTAFRQALTMLNKEVSDTDSVIGQALQGWSPSIDGLTGAIKRMEDAGITGAQAMDELGIRGGKAVAAQLALGSEAIAALGAKLQDVGDVTAMYATQMDTVHNQWKVFKSMIEESGLKIWDSIKEKVMEVVKSLQDAVKWVNDFVKALSEGTGLEFLKAKAEEVAPAIAQALADIGSYFIGLIDKLRNNAGNIEDVIWEWGLKVKDGVNKIGEYIQTDAALTLAEAVGYMIGQLSSALSLGLQTIIHDVEGAEITVASALWSVVSGIFLFLGQIIKGFIEGVVGDRSFIDSFTAWIYVVFLEAKLAILERASMIYDAIREVVLSAFSAITTGGLATLLDKLGFDAAAEKVRETGEKINTYLSTGFVPSFQSSINDTKNMIDGVNETLYDLTSGSAENTQTFTKDWEDALDKLGTSAQSTAEKTTSAFGEMRDSAGNLLVSLEDVTGKAGTMELNMSEISDAVSSASEVAAGGVAGGLSGSIIATLPDEFGTDMNRIVELLDKVAGMQGVLWA